MEELQATGRSGSIAAGSLELPPGIELRLCPECFCRIEKNDGCDTMACYRCGHWFDWSHATLIASSANTSGEGTVGDGDLPADLNTIGIPDVETITDNVEFRSAHSVLSQTMLDCTIDDLAKELRATLHPDKSVDREAGASARPDPRLPENSVTIYLNEPAVMPWWAAMGWIAVGAIGAITCRQLLESLRS